MEVVVTTGAKLQSNHHQQTNSQFFLHAGCPSCHPTNSVKAALKGKISHSMDLLTPSSPGRLTASSLTTNSSWLPWGRVAMPLISPLMPVLYMVKTLYSKAPEAKLLSMTNGATLETEIAAGCVKHRTHM